MASYYPPVGFHFRVEFDGIAAGQDYDVRFQEVSGLNMTIETEAYQEGGENRFAHRFPKPPTFANLTMKRGMLIGSLLAEWFRLAIENFEFDPKDVTVILMNENHEPLEYWTFIKAYPVKWNVDPFNAQDGKIVFESIELAYQYFYRGEKKAFPTPELAIPGVLNSLFKRNNLL
jgi:phage tail-like protein